MKYLALAVLPLIVIAAPASAERDRGPGLAGQRQGDAIAYPARDFDSVELAGAARVVVRTGASFSVRAEGPPPAFANFRVARTGRKLEIGHRYDGRNTPLEGRITVYVTLPVLVAAAVGGSGSIDADRGGGTEFSGAVGGSGNLRVARLEAGRATLSVGGSGTIVAAGEVGTLKAAIGGSGDIAAPNLRASRADVSVGGSGSVRATVAGSASVSIAGSGNVDLGPQAHCAVSKVGSGSARCGR